MHLAVVEWNKRVDQSVVTKQLQNLRIITAYEHILRDLEAPVDDHYKMMSDLGLAMPPGLFSEREKVLTTAKGLTLYRSVVSKMAQSEKKKKGAE